MGAAEGYFGIWNHSKKSDCIWKYLHINGVEVKEATLILSVEDNTRRIFPQKVMDFGYSIIGFGVGK